VEKFFGQSSSLREDGLGDFSTQQRIQFVIGQMQPMTRMVGAIDFILTRA
jgi:hypothetical protein